MSEHTPNSPHDMVSVYDPEGASGELVFTFVPTGPKQERGPIGASKRVPQFIVAARQRPGDGITFDWSGTQDDPKSAKGEIEKEAEERIKARAVWIDSVQALVDQVIS
jgi:hypothetical protein